MKSIFRRCKPFLLLPLLGFLLFLAPSTGFAQTRTFYWERYDVDITLLENGDLRFEETQTLVFSGGTFSSGFISIPTGYSGQNDGITNITVSEGGIPYTESTLQQNNTFQVTDEGNELFIDWFFEPTTGNRTYNIGYTVKGAVIVGTSEQGDGDQIYWTAIPSDSPALVESSTVTIRLPEGVTPQVYEGTEEYLVEAYIGGQPGDSVDISVSENGRVITYRTTQPIAQGQKLEVRVQWPHGILDIPTPNWQYDEQIGDTYSLVVIILSVLLLVGGPLGVVVLWYTYGRDPDVGIVVPEYITEPPDSLSPALVGTLVDEKADMRDIISILVDLAQRDFVIIGEGDNQLQVFTLTDKPWDELRPFERQFIGDFFGGAKEQWLQNLRYKFASKLPKLRQMLYEELTTQLLIPRSPESIRGTYGCWGAFLFMLAFVGFFPLVLILPTSAAGAALCPPIALGITAVSLLIASYFMPVKTAKGAETAIKWKAFKNYLQNIEKYENLNEAGDIFGKYIAYATAFGLERTWISKFAAYPATPIPRWYRPYYHRPYNPIFAGNTPNPIGGSTPSGGLQGLSDSATGGLQSMSDGFNRMLNNTATVLKSVQPPSSSGGGSSGRSSRGFSGGGGRRSGGGGRRGFR